MNVSREIKTAVIVLIIIALSFWGFNFLKNKNLYEKTRTFYAEYTNVQGLAPKSPITINGLKVGNVSDISFHPTKRGVLVAHLQLNNDVEFSVNSIAQIYSPDFISGKSLKINLSLDDAARATDVCGYPKAWWQRTIIANKYARMMTLHAAGYFSPTCQRCSKFVVSFNPATVAPPIK